MFKRILIPLDGSEDEEAVLIQSVQAGDQEAFAHLVACYQRPLWHWIARFVKDPDLADDILQQVFLQLYLAISTHSIQHSLRHWLFRVARYRSIDALRRQHRRPLYFSMIDVASDEEELSPLALLPDPHPLPEELAEQNDLHQHIQQAISALPERVRAVVWLRYSTEQTFATIAQTLNMPESTAKTYFSRTKRLLRVALTEALR